MDPFPVRRKHLLIPHYAWSCFRSFFSQPLLPNALITEQSGSLRGVLVSLSQCNPSLVAVLSPRHSPLSLAGPRPTHITLPPVALATLPQPRQPLLQWASEGSVHSPLLIPVTLSPMRHPQRAGISSTRLAIMSDLAVPAGTLRTRPNPQIPPARYVHLGATVPTQPRSQFWTITKNIERIPLSAHRAISDQTSPLPGCS